MECSISGFARLTGLSAHTLRYYEKEGLLTAKRGRGGQRYYLDADLAWVEFIKRLKDTGMPIKEIKRYADLRAQGESTLEERLALLRRHRQQVAEELARWKDHLKKLTRKIEYYEQEIARLESPPEPQPDSRNFLVAAVGLQAREMT